MKPVRHRCPMVLAICLLCAGCAARAPATLSGNPAARNYDDRLRRVCGRPVRYPISLQCNVLLASVGPLLKQRGQLVIATWRSCPAENPCRRIIDHDPACAGASSSAGPPSADGNTACVQAQKADYSCAALLQDRIYLLMQRKEADPECQQAKADLARFDNAVENVGLQVQWYRSLTGQGH